MDKWLIRTPRQSANVTQTRRSHSSATGSTDSEHGDRQKSPSPESSTHSHTDVSDCEETGRPTKPAAKKMRGIGLRTFQDSWKAEYPWVR